MKTVELDRSEVPAIELPQSNCAIREVFENLFILLSTPSLMETTCFHKVNRTSCSTEGFDRQQGSRFLETAMPLTSLGSHDPLPDRAGYL